MKVTDTQYNQILKMLDSAIISTSDEHGTLKETAPGVYSTKGYASGVHSLDYYSLNNGDMKTFFSNLVNQKEENIVTMHRIKYSKGAKTNPHYDKSTFTLVIMMDTKNLKGGEFYINGKFIPFSEKQEYITYNGGKDMHEVREITDGYREVMVVWWYDENDIKPNTNLI